MDTHPKSPQQKLFIFRVILLSAPFILLLLLEGSLRWIYPDKSRDLFIETDYNPDYLTVNQEAGQRYFQGTGYGAFGTQDVFRKIKSPRTLRIFVLGGSTAAGYPYLYSGSFATMLKSRLADAYPDHDLEVINLGMTAINSYTIRDFARECLQHEPDLLIIYAGHNEYYGALGSGSSQSPLFRSNRTLTLLTLRLKQLRITQLIRSIVQSLASKPTVGTGTLMARMARDQSIPYRSRQYRKTHEIYRRNIQDIITWAKDKDTPVVLGTLASNLRDQRPFVSIHSEPVDTPAFQEDIDHIRAIMIDQDYPRALRLLQHLVERDSTYALTYFYAGRCAELLGDFDAARSYYRLSRDYDGLRFRASSDLNTIIRTLGESVGVSLTDIEAAFKQNSPNGLPGYSLMLEHLHPNLDGYFIMAAEFAGTILDSNLLRGPHHPNLPKALPSKDDRHYRARIAVSELDKTIANYRIRILTSGWPFKDHQRFITIDDLKPETLVETQALAVLDKSSNYEKAHVFLAEHYSNNEQWPQALKEYQALAATFPINESPLMAMSRILVPLGLFQEAQPILEKTLTLTEDVYSTKWLGTIQLNNGNVQEALPLLQMAFRQSPMDGQVLYNLSGAYFLAGDTLTAIEHVDQLITLYPDFPNAQSLSNRLKQATGSISE